MAKKARKNILKLSKEDPVIMICQEGPCHKEDHLFPGMDLMVIVFLVLTLVIRLWIADSMKKEVLEVPTTQSRAGHATMWVTLLHSRRMRCYSCSGLGHKAQDCWSTQKQPMRRISYSSSRKASTDEGTNVERTDAKKQVWMKKTE